MTARILVVDDVEANVRLLQAKLELEYYEVITASDGQGALQVAAAERPDMILLDVMMPGMDGFETCRRLKADPATRHIPVVLVTALDGRADRVAGLEAGADDFITKPIDDVILFARVKSLARLKWVMDELREREETGRRLGVDTTGSGRLRGSGGRVLLVDDNPRQTERIVGGLSQDHRVIVEPDPVRALETLAGPIDVLVVNASSEGFDGLRLVAQARSRPASRKTPILCVVDPSQRPRMIKALDLGANDVVAKPVDTEELAARVKSQVLRKRYTDYLKDKMDYSLEMAVTDALTGLHNRRYMAGQLQGMLNRAVHDNQNVAVLLLDIDHFKSVNDSFGHDAGDEVLREFAVRLATNVRAIDLACRMGGEEFVVVMPDTTLEAAASIADRIRRDVAAAPFRITQGDDLLTVTVSVGVAASVGAGETPETLLKRADTGVYAAKARGRNQVIAQAA